MCDRCKSEKAQNNRNSGDAVISLTGYATGKPIDIPVEFIMSVSVTPTGVTIINTNEHSKVQYYAVRESYHRAARAIEPHISDILWEGETSAEFVCFPYGWDEKIDCFIWD